MEHMYIHKEECSFKELVTMTVELESPKFIGLGKSGKKLQV